MGKDERSKDRKQHLLPFLKQTRSKKSINLAQVGSYFANFTREPSHSGLDGPLTLMWNLNQFNAIVLVLEVIFAVYFKLR